MNHWFCSSGSGWERKGGWEMDIGGGRVSDRLNWVYRQLRQR